MTGVCDHWALVSFASLSEDDLKQGKILKPQPLWTSAKRGTATRKRGRQMMVPDSSSVSVAWNPEPFVALSRTLTQRNLAGALL